MTTNLLFISVLFVTLFGLGLCIDCHQCASKDDGSNPPYCSDPYDGDEMADEYVDGCGDRDTHCLKSKAVSHLMDSGFILGEPRESVVVTRGCIRADGEGDYCRYIESDAGFFLWCICSTDECNSAVGVLPSLVLMLCTILAGVTVQKFL